MINLIRINVCLLVWGYEIIKSLLFFLFMAHFCYLQCCYACTEQMYVSHVMLCNKLNFVDLFLCDARFAKL